MLHTFKIAAALGTLGAALFSSPCMPPSRRRRTGHGSTPAYPNASRAKRRPPGCENTARACRGSSKTTSRSRASPRWSGPILPRIRCAGRTAEGDSSWDGLSPPRCIKGTHELEKLPDQLQDHLRLVFVGTAAGQRSADTGHYYAGPGNRFWRTIHEVGITPRRYEPHEFPELLKLGIGFTDVCKLGAGMDHQALKFPVDIPAFRDKMRRYRPTPSPSPARKPRACSMTGRRTRLRWADSRPRAIFQWSSC